MMRVIELGLAWTFLIGFVRALPWPTEWLKVRPLSCGWCMSGWLTLTLWATRILMMLIDNPNAVTTIRRTYHTGRSDLAAAGLAVLLTAVIQRLEHRSWSEGELLEPPKVEPPKDS
ncbi:MAG: hypothetical protein KGI71_05710 [Patescibacteria group bacterium]|nr:hypothetical protein [Patescibacteria group bacterium]